MWDNSYATILLTQLSKWIRGSRSEHVRKFLQTVPTSSTYGIGALLNMSLEGRRKLLQAGWIIRLLQRTMIYGAGENLGKSTAMNIFTPSPHADAFLTEPKPVLLPKLKACSGNVLTTNLASSESAIITKKRNSKGCQTLPIIRGLLSNLDCWFEIKGSSDYQFPGKLECECNMFCMYVSDSW